MATSRASRSTLRQPAVWVAASILLVLPARATAQSVRVQLSAGQVEWQVGTLTRDARGCVWVVREAPASELGGEETIIALPYAARVQARGAGEDVWLELDPRRFEGMREACVPTRRF
jgi:hypothetical protein